MAYIYSNASAVLILDEWLRQIPSTSPKPVVLARTYQSNWIKRLWTHQEGFFPKQLFVQFSDKALSMATIVDMAKEYEKEMIPKGIYLRFPNVASTQVAMQYSTFKGLYDLARKDGHTWTLYLPLADIMRVRRTSRQCDETKCLATILGFDLGPYLAIQDKPDRESATKRMPIFLKAINTFNMGLIFNNWERLEVEGFGWAPRSLLSHRGGEGASELGALWDSRTTEIQWNGIVAAGLPVLYPGFGPFDFAQATRLSINCADCAFIIEPERDDQGGSAPVFFVAVNPNDIFWDKDTRYAVIVSKVPKEPSDEGELAVIGKVSTVSGGVITFHHLCVAKTRMLKDEPSDWINRFDTVTTKGLAEDTNWLVL
jgi:hypothetical protein